MRKNQLFIIKPFIANVKNETPIIFMTESI